MAPLHYKAELIAARPLRRVAVVVGILSLLFAWVISPPAAARGAVVNDRESTIAPAATVTLVTGDRVRVTPTAEGEPRVEFAPRNGDLRRGFSVRRTAGRVQVIPHDVATLVPEVLDPALFDVTGLIEMGYGDAQRSTLPLIVRDSSGPGIQASAGLMVARALPSLHARAAMLDKKSAERFGQALGDLAGSVRAQSGSQANAPVLRQAGKIWLDARVKAVELDGYLSQVRAPGAWNLGLNGSGVKVAVLDTGVDEGHPALSGQVDSVANFTDEPSADDGNGHGTHVASLVAGNGAGSDGARQGVAPGADLLIGKVLNSDGTGQTSWVIAGMEWAASHGADVVNLSLGSPARPSDDPAALALDALTDQYGTLFVAAAGNSGWSGRDPGGIGSPGVATSALTVAAVGPDDRQADFSSEGPTYGTNRLKPDVAAPGIGILGARAGARTSDLYVAMTGTSQAAPIVTGGAALLLQKYPDWTWRQVKAQIVTTAATNGTDTAWTVGGGRLDLAAATSRALRSDLANLDFGLVKHLDEGPRSKTVTITNTGADPVTLQVTDQVFIADFGAQDRGTQTPEASVVAAPATLTVPAGGTASTTITLDPGTVGDGVGEGYVVFAAGGETMLRLPLGFVDETPHFDVHLKALDRHHDPAATLVRLVNGDDGYVREVQLDEHGKATVRVPPGTYSAFASIATPAGFGDPVTYTIAGDSAVDVQADTEVVIDAQAAKRLDPPQIIGQATTVTDPVGIFWTHLVPGVGGFTDILGFDPEQITNGQVFITPTEPVTHGVFEAALRWRLAPTGRTTPNTPVVYELFNTSPRFTDPLSPKVDPRDLARVEHTYPAAGQPETRFAGVGSTTSISGVPVISFHQINLPSTVTMLMTASPDVQWSHALTLPDASGDGLRAPYRSYAKGERIQESWGDGIHAGLYDASRGPEVLYFETGIADGEHVSQFVPKSSQLSLYFDDELIGTSEGTFGWFWVSDRAGRFRLRQQWQLDENTLPVARTAMTTWEFDSQPPSDPNQPEEFPALLDLDYRVNVDALGRIPGDRAVDLGLTVSRKQTQIRLDQPHLPQPADTRSADVWASSDGTTWVQLRSELHRDSIHAVIPPELLLPGGQLSLRVRAVAGDGTSIDQTVIGMYQVRQSVGSVRDPAGSVPSGERLRSFV